MKRFCVILCMLMLAAAVFAGGTKEAADSGDENGIKKLTYFYRITSPEQETHIKWLVESFNEKNAGKICIYYGGRSLVLF